MRKLLLVLFLFVLSLKLALSSATLNEIELPEFSEPVSEPTVKKPPTGLAPGKILIPPGEIKQTTNLYLPELLLLGGGSHNTFFLTLVSSEPVVAYQFQQKKISGSVASIPFQETSGKISVNNLKGNLFYYFDPEIRDNFAGNQRKTIFRINPYLEYFFNKDNYLEVQPRMDFLNLHDKSFANYNVSFDYSHYFGDSVGISLGAEKQYLTGEDKSSELSSAKISWLLNYRELLTGNFCLGYFSNGKYFYSGTLTSVPFPDQRFQIQYQENQRYFILTELYSPEYIYNPFGLPPLNELSQTDIQWQYFLPEKFSFSLTYRRIYEKNSPVYVTSLDGSGNPENSVEIKYHPDLTRNFWTVSAEEKFSIFNFQQDLTVYSGEKITYQPELTASGKISVNFCGITLGTRYQYRSEWLYNQDAPAFPENKILSLFGNFSLNNFTSLNLEVENITGEKIYHQPGYFTAEPLIFFTFIAKI